MFSYGWPIALVVFSNVLYQICAKSVPSGMNPLASLTVTYAVSAAACASLYYLLNKDADILREYSRLNWAPFIFGIVLVGLEVGFIYAYKAGWEVSMASIAQSAFVAVALIAVGTLLYHEPLSWNKIVGAGVCLAGLIILNHR